MIDRCIKLDDLHTILTSVMNRILKLSCVEEFSTNAHVYSVFQNPITYLASRSFTISTRSHVRVILDADLTTFATKGVHIHPPTFNTYLLQAYVYVRRYMESFLFPFTYYTCRVINNYTKYFDIHERIFFLCTKIASYINLVHQKWVKG